MTVFDNIRTAAEISGLSAGRGMGHAAAAAHELIDRLGLGPMAQRRADALPTGQARLVELGRVLATQPKVILLDEPASGLNETETLRLAAVLGEVKDQGIGVLLVEHDMDLVMDLCSTICVLNFGALVTCGSPAEVRSHPAVQEAYLGSAV
jgi:branched-chain amino acid transport system ATP-binding protein